MIDAVWETRAHEDGSAVRILPDGCVDLVWHADALLVAGPDRVARMASVSTGASSCGVRFRPGSARAAFGVPGEALAPGAVPAGEVLGSEQADRLTAALSAAPRAERPALLRRWASDQLGRGVGRDPVVTYVSDALAAHPAVRVAELASQVGLSERQLRRRVRTEVGYAPKLLARILRLQRTLAIADADRALSLADAALLGGYADQAHLGHECAALAGTTPRILLSR
ncbi:MAG: helix-turn-helix domain-containing protein [Solirubrobacteraceae bacterium]|nr:helix-turn-helix domain-containing protein [Solirubrobacteraceae bacterium]